MLLSLESQSASLRGKQWSSEEAVKIGCGAVGEAETGDDCGEESHRTKERKKGIVEQTLVPHNLRCERDESYSFLKMK
jgi:hypothetical protein